MNVLIKKPRTIQPQNPVSVDWSNHLLKDVDFIMLGSQKFFNPTNKVITRVGNLFPTVTTEGVSVSVNDTEYLSYPNRDTTGGTSEWTIAGIFIADAVPTTGSVGADVPRWGIVGLSETPGDGTEDRGLVMLDASDSWGGYLYDGAQKGVTGPAVVAGKVETLIVTSATTVLTISGKGFADVTTAISNNGYNGYASAEFCVGNPNPSTNTPTVRIPLLVRTFTAWNDQQRKSFINNPWQIFSPQKRVLYIPSAAAPAGTARSFSYVMG